MAESFDLDRMLEEWDEQLASDPSTDLDLFIRIRYAQAPTHLVEQFRREVLALAAFDEQLHAIGRANGGTTDTSARSVPEAETNGQLTIADLKPGVEPVSGYTLVERLGSGGFGEVWKASAPGGFHVALKFVRLEGRQGLIEKRALSVIKEIRHPNLLSVFGAWEVDQFLIIATELANRTLWDRFQEAVKEGCSGIPRGELLEYFTEAAKGIDHLNAPLQPGRLGIQHRDIKPQNLLLSGGGVKVADFGLARALHHDLTGHTGSLTLAYAAPECLDGSTSSRSDQYSLAVSYCQLRGGRLPFEGRQVAVIDGHRSKPPDLSMLPPEERDAVARALAKSPDDRWSSCTEFVQAVRECSRSVAPAIRTEKEPQPAAASALSSQNRRWWLAFCVLSAVIVLGLIGIGSLSEREAPRGTGDGATAHGVPSGKAKDPLGQFLTAPASPTQILNSDRWTWSDPVNLGPTVNSKDSDARPILSPDGLTLLFTSTRPRWLWCHGCVDVDTSKHKIALGTTSQPRASHQ